MDAPSLRVSASAQVRLGLMAARGRAGDSNLQLLPYISFRLSTLVPSIFLAFPSTIMINLLLRLRDPAHFANIFGSEVTSCNAFYSDSSRRGNRCRLLRSVSSSQRQNDRPTKRLYTHSRLVKRDAPKASRSHFALLRWTCRRARGGGVFGNLRDCVYTCSSLAYRSALGCDFVWHHDLDADLQRSLDHLQDNGAFRDPSAEV